MQTFKGENVKVLSHKLLIITSSIYNKNEINFRLGNEGMKYIFLNFRLRLLSERITLRKKNLFVS